MAPLSKIKLYWNFPELFLYPATKVGNTNDHLKLVMHWLKLAQDVTRSGGVSNSYNLLTQSWGQAYRETTGYIIPTFLNYYLLTKEEDFLRRATKMGDWEIAEQTTDGAVGEPQKDGKLNLKVFNTGQVILGWCALFDWSKNQKYLDAAIRAANWLLTNQEADGVWKKFSNNGANGIDTRVAWSLLEIFKRTSDEKYKIAARKFLRWALDQQQENGWFSNSSLRDNARPWTHAIVYTISGILESAIILNNEEMFVAAEKSARAILNHYQKPHSFKYLPGSFDEKWQTNDRYSCLTGNAQIAIIWFKLYAQTGNGDLLLAATKMIEQLKELQITNSKKPELKGALPGSFPIDGDYAMFSLPNWSAKFLADALMLSNPKQSWNIIG